MDPTKPVLDLYSESYHRQPPTQHNYTHQNNNRKSYSNNKKDPNVDISYTQLKQKYQELYQDYNDKVSKLNEYEYEVTNYQTKNEKLSHQIRDLKDKNDQLNTLMLKKNTQLEEAYRRMQSQIKKGNSYQKNQQSIDRLEDGIREAINSNFHLLKEATLSDLKQTKTKYYY